MAAPIQIMPLGDSLTDGYPTDGGYRGELYNDLTNAGVGFQFVGSATDHPFFPLVQGQQNHEGHSGYMINQIKNNLAANDGSGGNNGGFWLNSDVQPSFVLLLIGDADFANGNDPVHAIDRLGSLIDRIASLRPNAHVIVSNLPIRTDNADLNTAIESEYNPFVPGLVSARAAQGERVSFLDLHSLIAPSDLYWFDNAHLNQTGYNKLGDAWFAAIQAVPEPSTLLLLAVAMAILPVMIRGRLAAG